MEKEHDFIMLNPESHISMHMRMGIAIFIIISNDFPFLASSSASLPLLKASSTTSSTSSCDNPRDDKSSFISSFE